MYLLVKIVVTSKHLLVEILVTICTLNVRSYRNILSPNNSRVVVLRCIRSWKPRLKCHWYIYQWKCLLPNTMCLWLADSQTSRGFPSVTGNTPIAMRIAQHGAPKMAKRQALDLFQIFKPHSATKKQKTDGILSFFQLHVHVYDVTISTCLATCVPCVLW